MEDTIAAIATAMGEGGIGIIRISGEKAKEILERIFVPYNSNAIEKRKMTYGHIVNPNDKKIIDEVLCVYMNAPKTYTAEDVVEIDCHGGVVSLKKILELVLSCGARMAEPGEFTKRAFLNGRLDLSQAEAVIDVIRAKTDKSFDVAIDQLEGLFSAQIKEIRKKLVDILVNITVNIDYPDEDIEEIVFSNLEKDLNCISNDIKELLDSAETGRILKEGIKIAIIGKPNVGKSSLMNNLLREARAIVTDIPGTTRDTIEEFINIKGIPVRLVDTAGIRETDDKIEKIGIEKSKISFNEADIIIFIVDASRSLSEDDYSIIDHLTLEKTLILLNKTDLDTKISYSDISELIPNAEIIEASMKNQKGIKEIEDKIIDMVYDSNIQSSNRVLVTNARHKNLLEKSFKSISDSIEMVRRKEALEFIEIDVNSAYALLGEIIGETVQDDIIDEVFSRFCLGK